MGRFEGLILFLFVVSLSLLAQTETATLSGRVTDAQGAAIVSADVIATDTDTNGTVTTKTNGLGIFIFPNLAPGSYRLTTRASGFATSVREGLVLHIQDRVEQNLSLRVGSVDETVTVNAEASLVNTHDASVSTVVDQTYVANMPLNGRSLQDLILLTPGIVTGTPQGSIAADNLGLGQQGEFSVNGQRTEENYYTVDGVSANIGAAPSSDMTAFGGASGSVAAATALGTTQALVSVDELQEFRVQTSSYSAEYGRNPGAQIAFETKSGTNQWHGTGYDYFRNDFFDANDWFNDYFAVKQPPLRQNDFGGTFGGPVRIPHIYNGKDKTFLFVSYEGLRLLQPQPAVIKFVPDARLRASTVAPLNQVLNGFPVPNPTLFDDTANGIGQSNLSWSNPGALNSTSVRFDHVVKDRTRLFFRFNNNTSYATLRGDSSETPTSHTDTTRYITRTYTGGAISLITSRLSNEFRLNYSSNDSTLVAANDSFGGSTAVDLAQLTGLGPTSAAEVVFLLGGQFLFLNEGPSSGSQKQWNLVDTLSYSAGRHQLKFGADYRRLTPSAANANPFALYFFTDASSTQANSDFFSAFSASDPAYPLFTNFSLFAQDEWKVTARLNLSMGLRWDVNPPPGATKGLQGNTLLGTSPDNYTIAPQGTRLWRTTWFNFAPRLGAAYVARSVPGRETVVRAGGGLFFDSGQQLGSSSFQGPGFSADSGLIFGSAFPCSPAPCSASSSVPQVTNPQPPYSPGQFFSLHVFYPHLQLPYTTQWNASLEQAMGKSQALTVTYLGSHAGRLLQPNTIDASSSATAIANQFYVVSNGLTSDYHALQTQFQRRLTQGLTVLASYTWSHCLDSGSTNYFHGYNRGNCDADVRHNFTGAFSYDLPNAGHGGVADALLHHWGIDDRVTVRTGFPIEVLGKTLLDPNTGRQLSDGVDFVPGKPIYIYGLQCQAVYSALESQIAGQTVTALPCPGGRAINPDAFTTPSSPTGIGNVPRNFARGFGAWQMNVAVRREFPIYEGLKLQFRAEAFNIFNHPNFGVIDTGCAPDPTVRPCGCTSSTFGLANKTLANSLGVLSPLYQMGGSRSMQFALKLVF